MRRIRKLKVGALNIKIFFNPSAEKYISLFKEASANKTVAHFWSDRYGFVSEFNKVENTRGALRLYSGTVYKFVGNEKLKSEKGIVHSEKLELTEGAILRIQDVPVGMIKQKIPFFFAPDHHLLVYDKEQISLNNLASFFRKLLAKGFFAGPAYVEYIKDVEEVDALLGKKQLKEIRLRLSMPNGDVNDDEDIFLEKLKKQNVQEIKINLKAPEGEVLNIDPNGRVARLARRTAFDGDLVAFVQHQKKIKEFKTAEKPLILDSAYNPKETTKIGMLYDKTLELLVKTGMIGK